MAAILENFDFASAILPNTNNEIPLHGMDTFLTLGDFVCK